MKFFETSQDNRTRTFLVTLVLFIASIAAFYAAGQYLSSNLAKDAKLRQISEINTLVLRRAETAINNGSDLLRQLHANRLINCNEAVLYSIRLHVFRQTGVKDIRVADKNGNVQCAAYADTMAFDVETVERNQMLQVGFSDLRLFSIDQNFGTSLGVMIDTGIDRTLIALVNIASEELDLLPAELRNNSQIRVDLGASSTVANIGIKSPLGSLSFSQRSEKYPIKTIISIKPEAFEAWELSPNRAIMLIAIMLGVIFAAILSRTLIRPENPIAVLDQVISSRGFVPFIQPVFDVRSGAITGAEILCRRILPDGTIIPPSRFIDIAEKSGRIRAITWQIFETAILQMHDVLEQNPSFRLSLNISPSHFMDTKFPEEMTQATMDLGVRSEQVVLELTERQSFDDLDAAGYVVRMMQQRGFKVSLDDVGIGHSGLSQIQALGANTIKIDKFFIDALDRDMGSRVIVQMLVKMADEMNVELIAEGVETEEQRSALEACGVLSAQGFLVAQPMPIADFIEFSKNRIYHVDDVVPLKFAV